MAYGARLESELGESPQGFKSPILRAKEDPRLSGVFSLPWITRFGSGLRDRWRSLAIGLANGKPLSSAIRKEHPFGCSFLFHGQSGRK